LARCPLLPPGFTHYRLEASLAELLVVDPDMSVWTERRAPYPRPIVTVWISFPGGASRLGGVRLASADERVALVLEVDRTVDVESDVLEPVTESIRGESVIEGWSLLTGTVGAVLADEEARPGGQRLREFGEQAFRAVGVMEDVREERDDRSVEPDGERLRVGVDRLHVSDVRLSHRLLEIAEGVVLPLDGVHDARRPDSPGRPKGRVTGPASDLDDGVTGFDPDRVEPAGDVFVARDLPIVHFVPGEVAQVSVVFVGHARLCRPSNPDAITLSTRSDGEGIVNISPGLRDLLDDFVEYDRQDVVDECGRKPSFTTSAGRVSTATIRRDV